MRFFLFALMIALLPLRGFAGDVMATEMAIQMAAQHSKQNELHEHHADATNTVAGHADHSAASGQMDAHHEVAGTQAANAALDGCPVHAAAEQCHSSDNHGSCQACQACHTVALSLAFTQVEPVFASSRLPNPAAAQFASAEAALGQKPPIS
jgi:hypothetical protein